MTVSNGKRAELEKILSGIDSDDTDEGWWETSVGAEFGAKKLEEVWAWHEQEIAEAETLAIIKHNQELVDYYGDWKKRKSIKVSEIEADIKELEALRSQVKVDEEK